jgi:hypothetical protein
MFVFAALAIMAGPSWAILTLTLNSPPNGTDVTPGQQVFFQFTASGAVVGISQISYTTIDGFVGGGTLPPSPPTNQQTVNDFGLIPIDQPPGTATLVSISVFGYADDPVFGSITVNVLPATPDTTPPAFDLGQVGIESVERLFGNTTANVTWFPATDDRTADEDIAYNVYASTVQANVFSGAPLTSVVGDLETQLTGLDPLETYHVGVRAEDEAGNEDGNTATLELAPLPNAVDAAWMLYQ